MIDLYTWPTPNGHKVHIMLEECALPYNVHAINIGKGNQFEPDFLKISPNNKMPAIIDQEGPEGKPYSLFESGAILMYLAEKTGMFMPQEMTARYDVIQWLMFQMGGLGPLLGQNHHFRAYAPEKIPYAIDRYTNEAKRLYNVLNTRLEQNEYLAGDYSIADIATFPWTRSFERQGIDQNDYPHYKRWFDAINSRPAVIKGVEVLSDSRSTSTKFNAKEHEILFGKSQYEKHKC